MSVYLIKITLKRNEVKRMTISKINKKISIIIPVYNSEAFLRKCINSLTKQSYKNLEIIIVNDCSPKNCKEIAGEYAKKDARIKYVEHEKNKGLFQARVTGFKSSTASPNVNSQENKWYLSVDS